MASDLPQMIPPQQISPMKSGLCLQSPTSGEAKITQIPKMCSPRSPAKGAGSPLRTKIDQSKRNDSTVHDSSMGVKSPMKIKSNSLLPNNSRDVIQILPDAGSINTQILPCVNCDTNCPSRAKHKPILSQMPHLNLAQGIHKQSADNSYQESRLQYYGDGYFRQGQQLYDTVYPSHGNYNMSGEHYLPSNYQGELRHVPRDLREITDGYTLEYDNEGVAHEIYCGNESEILDAIYNSKSSKVRIIRIITGSFPAKMCLCKT